MYQELSNVFKETNSDRPTYNAQVCSGDINKAFDLMREGQSIRSVVVF